MTDVPSAAVKPLRIVFAGTPEFARKQLEELLTGPHQVVAAYTQPDRTAGRGKKLSASPVKTFAIDKQVPVLQPSSLRSESELQVLAELQPDVMVVVAYGLILPQSVLTIPDYGCINVHASLLPRWRGAAPVERAIEAGDGETGITIMQMDAGLDTGEMLDQERCLIDEHTTGDSLRETLGELGSRALGRTLDRISQGRQAGVPQDDSLRSYARKLERVEAWIDWTQSAESLARKIRAFCSTNVCCTELRGERIKIWQAHCVPSEPQASPPGSIIACERDAIQVACGTGVLCITRLQLPGRKALDARAVLNARRELFSTAGQFTAVTTH